MKIPFIQYMQILAIGWNVSNYPPSYTVLANFLTLAAVLVVLIAAAVSFRRKWKNRKKR